MAKDIKAVFLPQGLVIGELIDQNDSVVILKNPCLVVTQQQGVTLAPFLRLVQEDRIRIPKADVGFNDVFSPLSELADHYNKIFSPIVTPDTGGLTLTTSPR